MIRIPVDRDALRAAIDRIAPTWWTLAEAATRENIAAGAHLKNRDGIWSRVKAAFVDLQKGKCGYCERRLGNAGIEWDMEHYRPKNEVKSWKAGGTNPADVGGASKVGYFRLAFDVRNYLVACKPCNTIYKSSWFPTGAARRLDTGEPSELRTESPFLINPADPGDTDPERLIHFRGVVPQVTGAPGPDRQRALATIELLKLAEREDLLHERAQIIVGVWFAFESSRASEEEQRERARKNLEVLCSDRGAHADCARHFLRLCHDAPAEAAREADRALALLVR
ncbi:hypothetical protein [Actinoplanes sp. NPDC051851]|uniref:hypothetical protein n=1 Tax=Actinoplanes sp. NPDC051851 TaxID=3154753 RepID=UPI003421AE99